MSFTIDVHHHILPDFFWRETNDGAHPVGGIAPPPWDEVGCVVSESFLDPSGTSSLSETKRFDAFYFPADTTRTDCHV